MKILRLLLLALCFAGPVRAGVIDGPNVTIGSTSYRTFIDQVSGLTWLDLDNFWDATTSYNSLSAALAGSNFHIATLSELQALQLSIPAIPANFASEVQIVGGNYIGNPHPGEDRNLIWGVYDDGNSANGISYSWKFDTDTSWQSSDNVGSAGQTFRSFNTDQQDLGAWVVSNSVLQASVPEPGSLALLGLGFAGLAFARRRKQ